MTTNALDTTHPTFPFSGPVSVVRGKSKHIQPNSSLADATLKPFDPYWTIVPPLAATFRTVNPSHVVEYGAGWYSTPLLVAMCNANGAHLEIIEHNPSYKQLAEYLQPNPSRPPSYSDESHAANTLLVIDNGPREADRIPVLKRCIDPPGPDQQDWNYTPPFTCILHDYQHPDYHTPEFNAMIRRFLERKPQHSAFVYDVLHPTTLILTETKMGFCLEQFANRLLIDDFLGIEP